MISATVSLYRVFKNCGIVKMRFLRYMVMKKNATIMSEAAASHSYAEIARPSLKPLPDIPINCSAEILEAISEAPMAHHVSDPSARKKSVEVSCWRFFRL